MGIAKLLCVGGPPVNRWLLPPFGNGLEVQGCDEAWSSSKSLGLEMMMMICPPRVILLTRVPLFCPRRRQRAQRPTQQQLPIKMPAGIALSADLRNCLIYMHITSVFDAKVISQLTGVPLRTVYRVLSVWRTTEKSNLRQKKARSSKGSRLRRYPGKLT